MTFSNNFSPEIFLKLFKIVNLPSVVAVVVVDVAVVVVVIVVLKAAGDIPIHVVVL